MSATMSLPDETLVVAAAVPWDKLQLLQLLTAPASTVSPLRWRIVWALQIISSILIIVFAVVGLLRRKFGPTAQVSPARNLTASSALFLISESCLFTRLLQDAARAAPQSWQHTTADTLLCFGAFASAATACMACVFLLVCGLAPLSHRVYNLVMVLSFCYLVTSVSAMREGLPEMALYSICLISSTWSQVRSRLNAMVFSDINTYIAIGGQRAVAIQDLPPLPSAVKPDNIHDILEEATSTTETLPGFWLYLYQVCAAEAWASFACEVVDIVCKFGQPWVLSFLLATRQPVYIVLLFLLGLIDTIVVSQALFQLKLAGAKYRAGLASWVFRQGLESGTAQLTPSSATNLVEVDVLRIQDFVIYIHAVWSAPVQIIISLTSIVVILSWQSALAALGTIVALLPVQYACNIIFQRAQVAYMKQRDKRMSLTSEAIGNTKMVKAFMQEPYIEQKLDAVRGTELQSFESITWASALMNFIMRSTPSLIAVVAFTSAVLVNGELSADNIFPTLLFCSLLIGPLGLLPVVLSAWAGCAVSYARVRRLTTPSSDTVKEPTACNGHLSQTGNAVMIDGLVFGWDKTASPLFKQVSLSVPAGGFIVIGSSLSGGKTTLARLLLGSLSPDEGVVALRGTVAYMPQESWLISGTVRDNILLGREFHKSWYEETITACALKQDLESFELGDMHQIGSHGAGLSGGQKTRVMLARAVYSRADTYIMDDPLSALDSKVIEHLMAHVYHRCGLLKGKTVVITSNNPGVRARADTVYMIEDGRLVEECSPPSSSSSLASTITIDPAELTASALDDETDKDFTSTAAELLVPVEPLPETIVQTPIEANASPESSYAHLKEQSRLVPMSLYRRWFAIAGLWHWVLMAGISLLANLSSIAATYILKDLANTMASKSIMHGLATFAAAGIGQSLLMAISLMMGWFLCLKPTSRRLHGMLAHGVLRSPLQFFRSTSSGDILNRFANDLTRHDMPLFGALFGCLQHVLRAIVCLIVFTIALPLSLGINLAAVGICVWLLHRCMGTLAGTRRLETHSRSPFITNLQESIDGFELISTFGCKSFFLRRSFCHLERNLRAYLAATKVEMWLFFRLYFLSAILQALAASLLFVAGSSSSLIGFVMSYMLQLSVSMAGTVITRAQIESEMVCVQRIFAMADTEPERQCYRPSLVSRIPATWPQTGRLTFYNFDTGYSSTKESLALKSINLQFLPCQITAVVGRSGAGKTSLALAMLRLVEATSGRIEVDGKDISQVPLDVLRSRVVMVPQDCATFEGTIRENLDPTGKYDDTDIFNAIQDSGLANTFPNTVNVMEHKIAPGGANISAAQLQLLGLSRCLLLDPKVIILDEPTAAMDVDSEKMVQELLASRFSAKTVILITHRLESAIDCDKVVVLESGEVVDVGEPSELYRRDGSFAALIKAAGLQERFLRKSQ